MGNCWAFDDVRAKHEKMHMQLTRDDDEDDWSHSTLTSVPTPKILMQSTTIRLMTLEDVRATQGLIQRSSLIRRTPVLKNAHIQLDLDLPCSLHLKLETLQKTGSYEIRGVVSQFATHLTSAIAAKQTIVGVAERNYILAFALASYFNGYRTHCLMMDEAAVETVNAVQRLGVEVTRVPNEHLLTVARELERDSSLLLMYPFEDLALISGYATVGLEIIDEIEEVDIVVVSCGAGSFLAGVAAAVKLLKPEVEVYGVEPENACNVYESLRQGHPISQYKYKKTVAMALTCPHTGPVAFTYCRQFADGVIRVTEAEIMYATVKVYLQGLVADPSACVAIAACIAHKIPHAEDKIVASILTTRNMTTRELFRLPNPTVMGVTIFPKTKAN